MNSADARFFAPPPQRAPWALWRPEEEALLRVHYVRGGIYAALAALPGREKGAIYSKAIRLKLRGPRFIPRVKGPRKYETSPAIDAAVRRVYEAGPDRREVVALARTLMRPVDWIYRRAGRLGLVTPRFKPSEWSTAELELLEKNAHKSVRQIARVFECRGFRRTENAICIRLAREGFERVNHDAWTANQLAPLLGVTNNTVCRWVREEGLAATRAGTDRTHDAWIIARAALRRWIATHAQHIDLRKVERYWFIDLAFGARGKT